MEMEMRGTSEEEKICCIQPPLEYPWLLFKTERGNSGFICSVTSPLVYKGFSIKFPQNFVVHNVFNSCFGWLILSNVDNKFLLWNPVISKSINLSPLELKTGETICGAVLSSPPASASTDGLVLDPNCMIMLLKDNRGLYLRESSSLVCCTIGNKRWTSVCYPQEIISSCRFKNAMVLNGSVYVEDFSNHKLFCMNQVNPTSLVVTQYCKLPRLPPDTDSFGHLVESCGEALYIVVTWTGSYNEKQLSELQAFKLDQAKLRWKRVNDVGDRVFILSRSYSVSSRGGQNTGGFVYYVCGSHLYSYSFADKSVSTRLWHSVWNLPESFHQPITYSPDTRLIGEAALHMDLVESGGYEGDRQQLLEQEIEDSNIDGDASI